MPQMETNCSIVRLPTSEQERSESSAGPTANIQELIERVQSLQQQHEGLRQYVTSVDQRLTAGLVDVRDSVAGLIASTDRLHSFFVATPGTEQPPFAALFMNVISDSLAGVLASGVLNQQMQVCIPQDMDVRVYHIMDIGVK